MTGEVVQFKGTIYGDELPESVLEKAKAWDMARALIIGVTEDGELRMGASFSDVAELLLLLKRAERDLMEGVS